MIHYCVLSGFVKAACAQSRHALKAAPELCSDKRFLLELLAKTQHADILLFADTALASCPVFVLACMRENDDILQYVTTRHDTPFWRGGGGGGGL